MSEYPEFLFPRLSRLPALPPPERRRRVVFVASPTLHPLELIGPLNVLRVANFVFEHSGRSDFGYEIEVVTSAPGVVYHSEGLTISAERAYHQLRGAVDTLLFTPMEFADLFGRRDAFLRWVARWSERVRRVGTICIGTYVLAEAGVLDGRRATTHWDLQHDFKARYPAVQVDVDPIYVKDGHVYTSAGATSGIDMTLALVEEDFGGEVALRAAQALVLFLKRPGGQSQFSVLLSHSLPQTSPIAELQSWIYEHLEDDLRVERLAARVHMSPRNFARVFRQEVGVGPGRFVERCRLEHARQCLQDSRAQVAEVAERCGYTTPDGMRLAFERHLGVSPRAYRQRFTTARLPDRGVA